MKKVEINNSIDILLKKYQTEEKIYKFKNKDAEEYYLNLVNQNNGSIDTEKYYGVDLNTFKDKLDRWYSDFVYKHKLPPPLSLSVLFFRKNL